MSAQSREREQERHAKKETAVPDGKGPLYLRRGQTKFLPLEQEETPVVVAPSPKTTTADVVRDIQRAAQAAQLEKSRANQPKA